MQFYHRSIPAVCAHLSSGSSVLSVWMIAACGASACSLQSWQQSAPGVLKALSDFMAASGSLECVYSPEFPFCPVIRFLKHPSKGKPFFFFLVFFEACWPGWWGHLSVFSGEEAYFIDPKSLLTSYLHSPQSMLSRAVLCLRLPKFNVQVCSELSDPSCMDTRACFIVAVGCFGVSY